MGDCVRFGDRLAKLVDAGVPVRDAAGCVGDLTAALLRGSAGDGPSGGSSSAGGTGGGSGSGGGGVHRDRLDYQAAKSTGVSPWAARRVLVERGLVSMDRQPCGKAAPRQRLLELLGQGWAAARAAREVGVHVRTARDWRDGIGKIGITRIRQRGHGHQLRDCWAVHTVGADPARQPNSDSMVGGLALTESGGPAGNVVCGQLGRFVGCIGRRGAGQGDRSGPTLPGESFSE